MLMRRSCAVVGALANVVVVGGDTPIVCVGDRGGGPMGLRLSLIGVIGLGNAGGEGRREGTTGDIVEALRERQHTKGELKIPAYLGSQTI